MNLTDSEQHPDSPGAETKKQSPNPAQPESNQNQSISSNQRQEGHGNTANELAREFRWVEWASVIINGGLAVIGVIALSVYGGQLSVMKQTLTIIQRQLEITDRPWISVTLTPAERGRMIFDKKIGGVGLTVRMNNAGRAVAAQVSTRIDAIALAALPASNEFYKFETTTAPFLPQTLQKSLCNNKAVPTTADKRVVFPGVESKQEWVVNFSTEKISTVSSTVDWKVVKPVVYGCIDYEYLGKWHQTGFIYEIDNNGTLIDTNREFRSNELRFSKWSLWEEYAN
jgi:hypothetical protein